MTLAEVYAILKFVITFKKSKMKNTIEQKQNMQNGFLTLMSRSMFFKFKDAVISVLPIVLIVFLLVATPLVDLSTKELITFGLSALALIVGVGLFNLGADMAMTPMGEMVGRGLTKSRNLKLLLIVCFVMGVLITIAEPDLSVLAGQVPINNILLIAIVGLGVAMLLVVAIIKIVFKKDLSFILIFFYMVVFAIVGVLIEAGKGSFLPLSFDSGGVTTGPITVPFIMALGVGVAMTVGGRNANENSFGLIALCSVGPVLAVLILSLCTNGAVNYQLADYSVEANLGGNFAASLGHTVGEVTLALGLIVAFFLILQFTVLKLPKKRLVQIVIGIVYTFVGLIIFLMAVKVGFMPIGYKIGQQMAEYSKAAVIVFAFVIGMVVVLAEPAVHILNRQVEDITEGAISKRSMLIALAIGVGISIGLSVLRVIFGFSLLYYLIPGYIISLGLSLFVPKIYTAIAFDSGGVASGPLTSSFILPFAIGVCVSINGADKVLDSAFGIVAMVAMTPLITIQVLGFRAIAAARVRERATMTRLLGADDEQIIDFT